MNKATVAKLEKLNALFKRHEEAIEQKFSAKQTAIIRYRIGAEDNTLHELVEVADHFKCSISYVTKVVRDITTFAKDLDKKRAKRVDKPVKKVPVQTEEKEVGVRVAIMSAKIENGKVTVKHKNPEVAAAVQADLQKMVDEAEACGECDACVGNKTKMSIAEDARKLGRKAESRGVFSFLAFISALLIAVAITVKADDLTDAQVAFGYLLVAGVAFAGLMAYISGVSYMGKRNGLLEGLRRL